VKDNLSESTQSLIQKEIKEAVKNDCAGMDCDVQQWSRVLNISK